VDMGASVDHVIPGYRPDFDHHLPGSDPAPEAGSARINGQVAWSCATGLVVVHLRVG
jgi:hypothetical protein